ncbi:hypothetical protein [Faecalispora jeddahensis]|uniref:hypothetical protein n=1 Tax=Faecalispora jeddahensis TaxID=1414721 RepID=UPI0028A93E2F|nr:hypothetical protein [Faecalispora jeddahensis]
MFEKRRREMEARRAEIRALLKDATDEELERLERELDDLDAEEAVMNRKEAASGRLTRGGSSGDPVPGAPNPIVGRNGAAPRIWPICRVSDPKRPQPEPTILHRSTA